MFPDTAMPKGLRRGRRVGNSQSSVFRGVGTNTTAAPVNKWWGYSSWICRQILPRRSSNCRSRLHYDCGGGVTRSVPSPSRCSRKGCIYRRCLAGWVLLRPIRSSRCLSTLPYGSCGRVGAPVDLSRSIGPHRYRSGRPSPGSRWGMFPPRQSSPGRSRPRYARLSQPGSISAYTVPPVFTGVVPSATVQHFAVGICPAPDDHQASCPNCGVAISRSRGAVRLRRTPGLPRWVISAARIVVGGRSILAAPDDHLRARPYRRVGLPACGSAAGWRRRPGVDHGIVTASGINHPSSAVNASPRRSFRFPSKRPRLKRLLGAPAGWGVQLLAAAL